MLRLNERELPAPEAVRALLRAGRERCGPEAFVFAGRSAGRPLATRTVSRVVRETARSAELDRPVCALMLRHSYAVHQLRAGMNIRALQEALGLRDLAGVLRYAACTPPTASSPLDNRADQAPPEEPAVAPIPEVAVEEGSPPFPVEQPARYFLTWLRASLRRGARLLRLSG